MGFTVGITQQILFLNLFELHTILLLTCIRNNHGHIRFFGVWGEANLESTSQFSDYTYFLHQLHSF